MSLVAVRLKTSKLSGTRGFCWPETRDAVKRPAAVNRAGRATRRFMTAPFAVVGASGCDALRSPEPVGFLRRHPLQPGPRRLDRGSRQRPVAAPGHGAAGAAMCGVAAGPRA